MAANTTNNKRDKKLIILGFGEFLVFSYLNYGFLQVVLPAIELQRNFDGNVFTAYLELAFIIFSFIIALAQILIGVFRLEKYLNDTLRKWLFISGIVITLLAIPLFLILVIYPLMDTMSAIK